ncbi:MAG: Asp-tRNA(Asn)/Glu-tRNA(Gln) amidotransferase subunit GatC [bacterium]|nr:Asp-tRNA(Asn)/Glu-tRNA(Gln) amidotransferase subunit GatC [bacterium]
MAGKLTASQVGHVARLANLPVTTDETSQFQKQLSEIVEYVGKIGEAKSEERKSKSETKEQTTREDTVRIEDCLTQDEAISNARNVHNGLFVAPHVFSDKQSLSLRDSG